ncbi:MAG TPA: hypothetical protein PLD10_25535 [Rhodopila sp.]|nr:hypothetical protein [Rhodopila sp.]
MRRVLMASAAFLGGSFALAHAQTSPINPPSPLEGQYAAPFGAGGNTSNNNNAWGIANTPTGSAAAGPLSTIRAPNTYKVPSPGTIVIHLNGRVEADYSAVFTTADKIKAPNGGYYKLNPQGVASDIRLYFGADGVASNGLRYGAAIEWWQNFYGGTVNSNPNAGSASGSGNTSGQTLFVRKEFAYLASDKVGIVRLGGSEGVIGLMDPCIFSSQCWDVGMGTLNGGGPQAMAPQNGMGVPWVFSSQSGAEYATNKISYLSPQVYGFDFAASFVPSKGNMFADQSYGSPIQNQVCANANPECLTISSGNDPERYINMLGLALRYQKNFGDVDFKTYGLWETSGHENLTTGTYLTPAAVRAAVPGGGANSLLMEYQNFNFYQAGVAVTYSNFTFALDYMGGQVNGQLLLNPVGGTPMDAWVAGVTYMNGPWTFGVMYENINTTGDARLVGTSQRHETGLAVGGNYKIAPGMALVLEYQYLTRHQGDYNFNTGAVGAGTQDARGQGMTFAAVMNW